MPKKIKLQIKAEELRKKLNLKDGHTPTKEEIFSIIKPYLPKDGKTPTDKELLYLIKPLIPEIDVSKIVIEASNNAIERILPKIPTIDQLSDKLPILSEEVRDSLELLMGDERLDASAIKGLPELRQEVKNVALSRGLNTYVEGEKKGLLNTIDFVGATYSKVNGRDTLTFLGGVSSFIGLNDTFSSYSGLAGKGLRVNATETGIDTYIPTDTDEKVKLSAIDLTAGYLNDKLSAGAGISYNNGVISNTGVITETDPIFNAWLGTSPLSGYLKLDQTIPQTIINGKPTVQGFVFNPNPTVGAFQEGKIYYDSTYKTLSANIDGNVNMQIGQELYIRVIAGENILDGQAVYINGVSGVFPLAYKAIATSEATARVKGIATQNINAGQEGLIIYFGIINGLNTNAWTAGDLIYLSASTAGGLTNVKPVAPNVQTVIGRVLVKDATVGSIYRSASPNYPISAEQIDLERVVNSTRHSVQDLFNTGSVGVISGGVITNAGSQKIAVSGGTGIIAIGTLDTDPVVFCDWSAKSATTVTDQRVTWVAVSYNADSPQIVFYEGSSATDYSIPTQINYQNVFPLGYVTRNGTELYVTNNPRRIQDATGGLIRRFYQTLPLARDERIGGLILGETGTRNITLTGGKLWDRQNQFTISAINTSSGGVFSTWYRNSGSGFIETKNVTQWPNTKYDNGSGTLADVTANKYANLWWYLSTEGQLAMVYGRATYANASSATLGAVPATLPLPIWTHYRLIGRTTFQNAGGTFVAIDSVFTNIFNPSASSTHNNLSGLQGGTLGEYYHLTSAQYSALHSQISFGITTQVPYMNTGGTGFLYSSNMTFDGTKLKLAGSTSNSSLAVGSIELQGYGVNNCWFGDNIYNDGSVFRNRATGASGLFYYQGTEGQFRFYISQTAGTNLGSGVGNTVQLKINQNGSFGVGSGMPNTNGDFTNAKLYLDSSGNATFAENLTAKKKFYVGTRGDYWESASWDSYWTFYPASDTDPSIGLASKTSSLYAILGYRSSGAFFQYGGSDAFRIEVSGGGLGNLEVNKLHTNGNHKLDLTTSISLTVPSGSETTIIFDTVNANSANVDYDTGTGIATITQAGWYDMTFGLGLASGNDGDLMEMKIRVNGTAISQSDHYQGASGDTANVITRTIYLALNDTVDFRAYHTHGSNRTTTNITYASVIYVP